MGLDSTDVRASSCQSVTGDIHTHCTLYHNCGCQLFPDSFGSERQGSRSLCTLVWVKSFLPFERSVGGENKDYPGSRGWERNGARSIHGPCSMWAVSKAYREQWISCPVLRAPITSEPEIQGCLHGVLHVHCTHVLAEIIVFVCPPPLRSLDLYRGRAGCAPSHAKSVSRTRFSTRRTKRSNN